MYTFLHISISQPTTLLLYLLKKKNVLLKLFSKSSIIFFLGLRTSHGICPPEVIRFLLDLFKYNDNTRNHYSDVYYRAALVHALGNSITPVVSVALRGTPITSDSLSADAKYYKLTFFK